MKNLLSEFFDCLLEISKNLLSNEGVSDFTSLEEVFEFSRKSIYSVLDKEKKDKEMVINPKTFSFMKKSL